MSVRVWSWPRSVNQLPEGKNCVLCPYAEDMMNGPCKDSFESSFRCFMKSEHPEVKGYDCLEHFEGFQACLAKNPSHLEEFLQSNKENE